MDYEDNFIQLVDEDGTEFNFEHVLTFDYQDKKYIVLLPTDEDAFAEDATEDLAAIDGAEKEDVEAEHDDDCDCGCCDDDEEGEIVILELAQDDEGNDLFLSIEDDDLLDELYNVYIETMESLEDEE